MQQAPPMSRYEAAVCENRIQLADAIFMKVAYFAVANVAIPSGFFQAAERALRGDVVTRACRAYDFGSQSASIWYVMRSDEKRFAEAAKNSGVNVETLDSLARRLRPIRDQVQFHLDKKSVTNSSQVWSSADLTWNEMDMLLYGGLKLLANLAVPDAAGPTEPVSYDGSDIRRMFPPLAPIRH